MVHIYKTMDLHSQPNMRLLDINYSLNVWSVLGRSYGVYRCIYHQTGCRINGSKVIGPLKKKKAPKSIVRISILRIKYDDTHIYENNQLILR